MMKTLEEKIDEAYELIAKCQRSTRLKKLKGKDRKDREAKESVLRSCLRRARAELRGFEVALKMWNKKGR